MSSTGCVVCVAFSGATSNAKEALHNSVVRKLLQCGEERLAPDFTEMLWDEGETPKWRNYCAQLRLKEALPDIREIAADEARKSRLRKLAAAALGDLGDDTGSREIAGNSVDLCRAFP